MEIEHLLGISCDRAAEIVTWQVAELEPLRRSLRAQVWRVIFMVGSKALLDGTLGREAARKRDRGRLLAEMVRREFGVGDAKWGVVRGKPGPRGEGSRKIGKANRLR